jgi:hypothetical protein
MTPTQRTMQELRRLGRRCAVVEKWNSFARREGDGPPGIRQDLFGIIDVLALDPERGVVGVQCCGGSGFQDHWRKLTEEHAQETMDWLSTPGTVLELWAWRKVKAKRGGKAMVWRPRIVEVTLKDVVGAGV